MSIANGYHAVLRCNKALFVLHYMEHADSCCEALQSFIRTNMINCCSWRRITALSDALDPPKTNAVRHAKEQPQRSGTWGTSLSLL